MLQQTGFSIVYLIKDELPKYGYRKLFFYTFKDEKYYYGTGANSFPVEKMKEKQSEGEILKLPVPQELEKEMGIWINSIGQVFYASLVHPIKNSLERKYLCTFDMSLFKSG